jgi:hypothetical protein
MNRRVLLLLVLVVLGILAWRLSTQYGRSTLTAPMSDFMVADTAKVDRIFIAEHSGNTVDLRRQKDGTWTANGIYPAKQAYVDLLLKTFLRVEVRSPVPKSAEANVLRVMSAASKKVEIYTGGRKPEKIWIVGHGTKDHFGTYMLLEKPGVGRSSVPFVTNMSGFTGTLSSRFHANMDDWRSSEVFRFADMYDIASVEVERPDAPRTNYRVEHLGNETVRLLDHKGQEIPFDTVLVRGALLIFQKLNYEYVDRNPTRHERDSILAMTPNHVLRLTRRNGTTEEAKFWYMPFQGELETLEAATQLHDGVRMHALVEDTLLVVVQRMMWDRVLQPVSALRP